MNGTRRASTLIDESPWTAAHPWYFSRGDLHVHTDRSDGAFSPGEVQSLAMGLGLDFMAMTDHNTWGPIDLAEDGVRLLPGMELTTTEGHMNVIAPRSLWRDTTAWACTDAPVEACLSPLLDGLASPDSFRWVVHPFLYPWHWQVGDIPLCFLDGIEIMNQPDRPGAATATERALEHWDRLTASGWRLTGVGGSDAYHDGSDQRMEDLGSPTTWVMTRHPYPGPRSIVQALKRGRVVVGKGWLVRMFLGPEGGRARSLAPGDCIPASPISPASREQSAVITVERDLAYDLAETQPLLPSRSRPPAEGAGRPPGVCHPREDLDGGTRLDVVTAGRRSRHSIHWQSADTGQVRVPLDELFQGARWVRMELRRGGELLAFTNPFFTDGNEPCGAGSNGKAPPVTWSNVWSC